VKHKKGGTELGHGKDEMREKKKMEIYQQIGIKGDKKG
jgi:hypothetical protein